MHMEKNQDNFYVQNNEMELHLKYLLFGRTVAW